MYANSNTVTKFLLINKTNKVEFTFYLSHTSLRWIYASEHESVQALRASTPQFNSWNALGFVDGWQELTTWGARAFY